jgi:peptide subunit release factor 1 (eRF1)
MATKKHDADAPDEQLCTTASDGTTRCLNYYKKGRKIPKYVVNARTLPKKAAGITKKTTRKRVATKK